MNNVMETSQATVLAVDEAAAPNATAPPAAEARAPAKAARLWLADAMLRQGAWSVFDQAIVSGTGFATSVILGRLGSKEDLGVYYLALSLVYFARGILEQLVAAPYVIYGNRKRGAELAAYTGSVLVHQGVLTALVAAALVVFALAVERGLGPAAFSGVAWMLAAAAPVLLFRDYVRQMSFARLQVATATAVDGAVAVLQLGGLLLVAAAGMLDVRVAYFVMAAACGAACLGWLARRPQPMAIAAARIAADWRRNWSFSRWALASQLVGSSMIYVMPWMLAIGHSTGATGMLAAASTLVGLANMFVVGLSNALTPQAARAFASGGVPELAAVLRKTAWIFVAALGTFALAALLVGEPVAIGLYGPKFAGIGPILFTLALALLAGSMGVTAGNGLWAMERPQANFLADVCGLAAAAAAALACVGWLGELGAALAALSGAAVGSSVRGLTLWRVMRGAAMAPPVRATPHLDAGEAERSS
jgi:O-antigen/teichoic acid export membrane protein